MRLNARHAVLVTASAVLAAWIAGEISTPAADRDKLPPDLRPYEVDVTKDQKYRWGEGNIAVNPKNPNNLVHNIMWDRFSYACQKAKDPECEKQPGRNSAKGLGVKHSFGNNWIGNRVYYTFDRGRTWTEATLPRTVKGKFSLNETGAFGGDPVVRATADGTFWIAFEPIHIGEFPLDAPGNYGCPVVSKSTDGGKTWGELACTGTPVDHEWIEFDESTKTLYAASAGHLGPTSEGIPNVPISEISDRWLTTSKDGLTWTKPLPMGGSDGSKHYSAGGRMTAGHGMLATAFAGRDAAACKFFVGGAAPCLVFQTTTDAGKTWKRHRVPSPPDVQAGFQTTVAVNHKKAGHFALAVMDAKSTRVLVFRTTDAGVTWKGPTAVTEDASKYHFKFAMAWSASGRTIGLVWRTRQSGDANRGPYNIWGAISDDEGATFTAPLRISGADSPAEDPNATGGGDDLSDVALNDEYAFFVWGDYRPGDRAGFFAAAKLAAFRYK